MSSGPTDIEAQISAFSHAWIPFTLGLAAATLFIWRVLSWRYTATFERLKEDNASLRAQVSDLRAGRLTAASVAVPTAAPARPLPPIVDLAGHEPEIDDTAGAQREFLDEDMTPARLARYGAGRTAIQRDLSVAPYLGKWLRYCGRVHDISVGFTHPRIIFRLTPDQVFASGDRRRHRWDGNER